ncbi:MAG: SIS domain-containing protein [Alphaproteobacteria bacterium]|nr:SIS domain-containing protein [Alphaproteobacteria bacterium]
MGAFKIYLDASREALAAAAGAIDEARVERAIATIHAALASHKPLLICGNGGSAADAMHIAGELVGRYKKERRALKAMALAADPAVLTAWSNDYSYDTVFARQVEAFGEPGGVLLALSTSGNSKNVIAAADAARKQAMTVVALTGAGGGKLGSKADILLAVPATDTPLIQQIHICLYHYICAEVEARIAR